MGGTRQGMWTVCLCHQPVGEGGFVEVALEHGGGSAEDVSRMLSIDVCWVELYALGLPSAGLRTGTHSELLDGI